MTNLEVQNAEVYRAREPLQALLQQPLPVKVAYGLTKLARKLSEQWTDIEAVRTRLIRQYGQEQEGKLTVQPGMDGWEAFVTAYNELMTTTVTLEGVWRVALPSDNGLEVSAQMLLQLEPFVTVEGAEA